MIEIKLSNGAVISSPENRIREYCQVEIYYGYDNCHEVNDIITLENISAANRLFAGISEVVSERITRFEKIRDNLAVIDERALGEISKEEWRDYREKLYNLLLSFCSIKGVGIAVVTKILHLKRPKLIPILDSFVVKFLTGIDVQNVWSKPCLVEIGIKTIDSIRKDIWRNSKAFTELQERLIDLPIPLSIVRLYDILVWSTEKWDRRGDLTAPYGKPKVVMRANSSAYFSSTRHEYGSDVNTNELETKWKGIKTLEEFREIVKKKEGYIVITDIANPNKIHRPFCQWVKEENFVEKVIKNKCRNGCYYWTNDIEFAQKKWGAKVDTSCI